MIVFTKQEKTVILFLSCCLLFGTLFQLIKKKYPDFNGGFFANSPAIVKININSATKEEWESLPLIGEHRASMILEARERQGRFSSVDDVRYVKGIGPYVFNQIRDFLEE